MDIPRRRSLGGHPSGALGNMSGREMSGRGGGRGGGGGGGGAKGRGRGRGGGGGGGGGGRGRGRGRGRDSAASDGETGHKWGKKAPMKPVKPVNKFNKLTITWDEEERNEYVSGFHKRKMQRRQFAEKMQKRNEAEIRAEKRAEKRAELQAQAAQVLGGAAVALPEKRAREDGDDEDFGEPEHVPKTLVSKRKLGDKIVTVTVEPLTGGGGGDVQVDGSGDDDDDDGDDDDSDPDQVHEGSDDFQGEQSDE